MDFPALPPGVTCEDVADVLPHKGREHFDRDPQPDEGPADYRWIVYSRP